MFSFIKNYINPSLPTVRGDLLQMFEDGEFNVIVHGCNCFCSMSGGIAAQIARRFPAAAAADAETVSGDITKLGTTEAVRVPQGLIINAYTQYEPGADVNYDAISDAFVEVSYLLKYNSGLKLGYPAIGAGIAGGDWNRISKIIGRKLRGLPHTFVEYKP